MNWSQEEFSGIDLGDKRLDKRAQKILGDLGAHPSKSIPAASGDWYATKATYNFFSHEKVNSIHLLSRHVDSLITRAADEAVLLCPQDTTELDFTSQKQNTAHGLLNTENRRGSYLHVVLVTTPKRLVLGILSMEVITRDKLKRQMAKEEKAAHAAKPIEEKENYRWIKGYESACELAQRVPDKQVVSISDRECDFYDFMKAAQDKMDSGQAYADWIVRGKWDRLTLDDKQQKLKVKERLEKLDPIAEIEYVLPGRDGEKGRKVKQAVRSMPVTLVPPNAHKADDKEISITALLLQEIDTPSGVEPLVRLLFSSVNADSPEKVLEIANWYLCRWDIEMLFKILKSGCKVEQLQIKSQQAVENAFILYLIIAWRIMYLTMLGRACPELLCNVVLTDYEWRSVYLAVKKKPPKTPPTLREMNSMIAALGGYLNRKRDAHPGTQVMWIGMQRMLDMSMLLEVFEGIFQGVT